MAMIRKWLATFFNQWQNLLTQPQWYWRASFATQTSVLSFFVVSCLILSLSSIARFQLKTLPTWRSNFQTSLQQIQTHYPQDLVFTWSGQKLTNTLSQPLVVPYPSYVSPETFGWPQSLATLLPEPASMSASTSAVTQPVEATSSSLLTITDQKALFAQQGGQTEVDLIDVPGFEQPFKLTADTLPTFIAAVGDRGQNYLSTLAQISVVIIPVGLILTLLWQSVVATLMLWFFFRISRWPYNWKIAWHLVLLVTLVAQLVAQIGLWIYPITQIPLYSLTFWILLIIVVWASPKRISLEPQE